MPGPWIWEDATHRYRSTSTGRFMGADDMLALRDKFVEVQREAARAISQRLIDDQTTAAQWLTDFRDMIRTSYIDQYVMARGGRGMMTQRDWGRVGQMVRDQYKYAQGFAQEIVDDKLSEAQILARSEMYPNASTEAYEKGYAEALGLPTLSQYPGDGSTPCLSNCLCHLEYEKTNDGWNVYWKLGATDFHCETQDDRPGCIEMAADWNPLHVGGTGG